MTFLLIKCLDSGGVVHQSYDKVSVVCRILLMYDNMIAIVNADIDHALSLDLQHKCFTGRHIICQQRKISLDVLLCKDRLSSGNASDQRHIDNLTANKIKVIVNNLNCTRLRRVAADISVLLKCLKMRMYGGG